MLDKDAKIYVAGHRGLAGSAIVNNLRSKGFGRLILRTHAELDLVRQAAVADFFAAEKPEYVFLAAAKVGGIAANDTYRADFIYENLMIQNNVIHQSYQNRVKKLLFLGSTCIYPKEAPQPISENCLLTGPLEYTNEPYAIAKIAGIKMCESYNLQYGANFISVMPTNLYGPNDNFDLEKSHVLPAIMRKMHLGKALESNDWKTIRNDLNKLPIEGVDGDAKADGILGILSKYGIEITNHGARPEVRVEIWGSGEPRREFLWSEELADACVFLMENRDAKDIIGCLVAAHQTPVTNYEIRNTHINIGTGVDSSIKELAEIIQEHVNFKGELFFNSQKPDGTMIKRTDPSVLNRLGWKHTIGLKDGIEKLYGWYQGDEPCEKSMALEI
ncbi:MAG: GDP-L-fucose synthase family protein [Methylococcales bacterium]